MVTIYGIKLLLYLDTSAPYWPSDMNRTCSDQNADVVPDKEECRHSYPVILSGFNTERIYFEVYNAINSPSYPPGCIIIARPVIHNLTYSYLRYSLTWNDNLVGGRSSTSRQVCETGKCSLKHL